MVLTARRLWGSQSLSRQGILQTALFTLILRNRKWELPDSELMSFVSPGVAQGPYYFQRSVDNTSHKEA